GRVDRLPPTGPRGVPAPGEGRPGPLPRARRPRTPRGDRRPGARAAGAPAGALMTAVGNAGSVWDGLVGQRSVIERLQRAVGGDMTHAWLFTGPPGSGRSNTA